MEIKRVFDILDTLEKNCGKDDIVCCKVNKEWKKHSVKEFAETSRFLASALLNLGLKKGDMAAIMSSNRPEWLFADYGIQQAGLVSVPIFPTISTDDLKYILQHSSARIIFISDKSIYHKLLSIEEHLPNLKHVIAFTEITGVRGFADLVDEGRRYFDEEKIRKAKESVLSDEVFTILYTSGTTGHPKGVMISHMGIISNVMTIKDMVPFARNWKALSFLPLNHVYERVLHTLYLLQEVSIYYAENFETIGDNCREIHPQVFVAVPRILERVLEKIVAAGDKLKGVKRKVFEMSMRIAESYEMDRANGRWYELKRKIFDRLVYSKWREAIGGEVVCVVSGGAALNPRLEKIFFCAGIPLLQGYGLTETSVVIAVNHFGKGNTKFGTVGPIVGNIEVKLLEEDGEILMKGPSLMKGYYKNPEATAEAIDSHGWFHTGDIGTFIEGRYLKITDRKKELFKTSAGKYISPMALENKLKESRFIENCMVVGANQKFASAIIIPNMMAFKEYCVSSGMEWQGTDAMRESDMLKKIINDHVKTINKTLAPYEQLKRCQLIKGSWSVDSGEITPKLSLKRKVIAEKNKASIDKIFLSSEE